METDYLVVGAGAAALAFVDSLIEHADVDVVVVDRRSRPGGHWNDAYPFVRLHQPSAYYGVNSRILGGDSIDQDGPNAGYYERATGAEVCEYFRQVMYEQFLPSGRVRYLPEHEYRGGAGHRCVSLADGRAHEIVVRRKLVDATYMETSVPATHAPSYAVEPGVRFVPVNALPEVVSPSVSFVLIGGGKTSMDACGWLLDGGVEPERIRWIRPRDSWFLDRAGWQPLRQVASILEGTSLELEAAAMARSVQDLFDRLEHSGRLMRLDESVTPTMYRCAILSRRELEQLRRVKDVVRLGRVVGIQRDRVLLERGEVAVAPETVFVDCSAEGLSAASARPIFEADRITLQQVRYCSPTFNAALIGYLEATRDDVAVQNHLCPPNPYPNRPADWIRAVLTTLTASAAWSQEADLRDWLDRSRLNLLRGMSEQTDEPRIQQAMTRFSENVGPAIANLQRLLGGVGAEASQTRRGSAPEDGRAPAAVQVPLAAGG